VAKATVISVVSLKNWRSDGWYCSELVSRLWNKSSHPLQQGHLSACGYSFVDESDLLTAAPAAALCGRRLSWAHLSVGKENQTTQKSPRERTRYYE